MNTKQAGGAVAPGQPLNPARPRQPCDSVIKPGCRGPWTLVQSKVDLLVSSSALVHAIGAESASDASSH
jgi:hypothetical protein